MRLLLFAVALALSGQSLAATNLIENGSFDADVSGWTFVQDPASSFVWDSFGNPAGSLRISNTPAAVHFVEGQGPCLAPTPGADHQIRGDAFAVQPYAQCRIEFALYLTDDCSGPRGSAALHDSPGGVWEAQTYTFPADWQAGFRSYRPALILIRNPSLPTTCHFDNITVQRIGGDTLAIPAAGHAGYAILALALAAGGALVLARRRADVSRRSPR